MAETLVELIAKIKTDATGLEKGLTDAERKTEASSKKMQDSLKKVGMVMVASGAAITGALGLMGKAAIDEEINIKRLATTINNSGTAYDSVKDSLEAVIAATQRKTGVADNEQRDILNRLILVTNDYGKAMELLPTVLDLAAAGEMDATTAATYLGKAYLELEEGAEEVSVRFGQASLQFKNMEDIQNRVAGSAENLANPLSVLKATAGDISEAIGAFLIPTIKDLVNRFSAISAGIQNWIELNPELMESIVLSTAKLGLLLLTIGSLILILPKIVSFVTMLTGLFGPWGWAVLAVTALIGYLVAELLGLSDVMVGLKGIMADVEKQMFIMRAEQSLSAEEWAKVKEQGYLTEQQFQKLAKAMELTTRELYNQMEASDMLQVSMTAVGDTNLYLKDTTKGTSNEVGNLTEQLEAATQAAKEFKWETEATKQSIARASWQADGYTYSMSLFSQAEVDAARASGKKIEMLQTQSDVTADNTDKTDDYVDSLNKATSASDTIYDSLKRQTQSAKGLVKVLQQIQYPEPISFTAGGEPVYSWMNTPTWAQEWGQRLGITSEEAEGLYYELLAKGESIVDYAENLGRYLVEIPQIVKPPVVIPKVEISEVVIPEGYATGGIVPGPIGMPQLATVHGGETIIPANESMGNVVVNFTQPVFFDREDTMNRFVDMISRGIDRKQRLRFGGAYSGG